MKNLTSLEFYSNLPDNTHCLQACLKMVLKYYFPGKDYSFEELDRITKHKVGLWTWQGAGLLALSNLGFEAVNIENLDYEQFHKTGEEYLKSIWTEEVYATQRQFSDLHQEREIAGELVRHAHVTLINRIPNMSDIERYFKDGYFIIASVNPYVFNNESGYASHVVLVTEIGDETITFNDPGLPPVQNKQVSKEVFLKSMTPPRKEDANLIALRYSS